MSGLLDRARLRWAGTPPTTRLAIGLAVVLLPLVILGSEDDPLPGEVSRGLDGWSAKYEPAVVGPAVSEADWQVFEKVLTETTAFARAGRAARAGGAEGSEHLDNQTLFDAVDVPGRDQLASVTPIGEHR
jgi:hypothetical protein